MDEGQRTTDLGILQRSEPARLGVRVSLQPVTNRLNHENIREPGNDGISTGAKAASFFDHDLNRASKPLIAGCRRPQRDNLWKQADHATGGRILD